MTEIERKALALVQDCVGGAIWKNPITRINRENNLLHEALCRAIEQHEAFRQEVSDARNAVWDLDSFGREPVKKFLARFIIAKPDPLVEAVKDCEMATLDGIEYVVAQRLRAAIKNRGGKIVWGEG